MICGRAGRIAIHRAHTQIQFAGLRINNHHDILAALRTEYSIVASRRSIRFQTGVVACVTKVLPGNPGVGGKRSAVKSPALGAVAMAEICDVAVNLVADDPALAVSSNHSSRVGP